MRRLVWIALFGTLLTPAAARAQSEDVVYYHTDAIGSVRMVTDASGAVVARYDYTPFGTVWPTVPPNPSPDVRQFAGKERDNETDLDYFGARYYADQTGRFTTVDPVLDAQKALLDPQRWNRYAYARNNPFVFIDPDGADITTPQVFYSGAFAHQNAENVRALAKVLFNAVQSWNLPGGKLTIEAEAKHFALPSSPAEAKRMRAFDFAFTAAAILSAARVGTGPRTSLSSVAELEPTHATTMSNRAFGRLKADIAQNGIQEPIKIVRFDGQMYVVDGHHRLRAAQELGLRSVPTEEVSLPYAGYRTPADLNYRYR